MMTLSEFILDVGEADFESSVILRSHEVPVVVDFWAEWCGPCKLLGPILERQAIEAGGAFLLAKVDVDENPNLAIRYGVQGIPAVKAFADGELTAEFVGAQPEAMVQRFINQVAPSEAEKAVERAQGLLGIRKWDQAEAAFQEILSEDETNSEAALGLVKSLLIQGRGGQAKNLLDDFPPGNAWASAESLKPLAEILTEAETAEITDESDALQASLLQSARLIGMSNIPAAMDGLLEILRQDKNYKKGIPKDILLALFSLLGDDDPLTRRYRDELASVLF
jgi:putative thioredoxin